MVRKELVQAHVTQLHEQLRKSTYSHPERAKRYASLIRRLSRKLRFRLSRPVKKSFCKHCYVPFAPSVNCRVRTRNGMLVYTCFSCKKYTKTVLSSK